MTNISRFQRKPAPPTPEPTPTPPPCRYIGDATLESHDRAVWQSLRSGPEKGLAELPYTFAQAWDEAHRIHEAELNDRIDAMHKGNP